MEKPAGPGRRRGICVKILLPGTELQGLAGRGEQTAPWKSGRPRAAARNLCEEFAPRDGAVRASGERGANRAPEKAAGPGLWRGICVKNLLPGTELQGFAGRGEQTAPWKSGRHRAAARNLCEEFAPRDGAARVSGEGGANRALEKAAGPGRRRGNCVKILLPETEPQGLAGNGEQTAPWKRRPAPAFGAESV